MKRFKRKSRKREPRTYRNRDVDLKTNDDIRKLLSETISELRSNKILPHVASRIIYACQVILTVFEKTVLQERLEKLEEYVKEQGGFLQ